MNNDLHQLLESVKDETSFKEFVSALIADRESGETSEWQNDTIESFLDSALAWADSTNIGVSQGLAPENYWKRFATFLYCGKIYE